MNSSEVEIKKDENIDLKNVHIGKNDTKSNFKFEIKKETKYNVDLQIGLDIIEKLELPVKNEIQDDFNPDIEIKKETPVPKSDDIIVEKCQAELLVENFDEPVNRKNRKRKLKLDLDLPVEVKIHDDFICDTEKKKTKEKEKKFPKGATMFMKGFKNDTTKLNISKAFWETFEIEDKAFASIENGQKCGYVIFHEENAAIELMAKIKQKLVVTNSSDVFTNLKFRIYEFFNEFLL